MIDAIGLYNNIPPNEGVQCVEEKLKENPKQGVNPEFIARLLKIILEYSVFEFAEQKYQQKVGTSMGTKPAPPYANIHMAKIIDQKVWKMESSQ